MQDAGRKTNLQSRGRFLKLCSKCKLNKKKTEFCRNKRTKDGLAYHCKQCANKLNINYFRKVPEKRKSWNKTSRNKLRDISNEYKSSRSCFVCKENNPYCLDLHHLDPSSKLYNPSAALACSVDKFLAEAKKCIVLCRNCHAKHHAGFIHF